MSSINNSLSSGYLMSLLGTALKSTGLSANPTGDVSPVAAKSDNSQLSPFAQLMSTLQQLQQSDPAKYQQVTQQIATNLQNAAQIAQSDGNTTAANQLAQLSTDFTNASKSAQLPSIQDLAQAIGAHHHRHHSHPAASNNDSTTSGSSSSTNQTLSQLLAAFQSSGPQNASLDPMSIISNTLSNAGITTART